MTGLVVAGRTLASRLLLGTGGLPRPDLVGPVLAAARPGLVTVSVRRTSSTAAGGILSVLREHGVPAVHLCMVTANTAARAFYDRLGFHEIPVPDAGPVTFLGRTTEVPGAL